MIHTLISAMGYDEPNYRVMLYHNFRVMSSKHLTQGQAKEFIDALQEKAVESGRWTKNTAFEELGNRRSFASPLQLRRIESTWRDITGIKDKEGLKKTLRSFLFKHVRVSDLRFVTKEQVTGILHAFRQIKKRKEARRADACGTPEGWQESV
jgi:dGTP triphosphohydrolase